MLWITHLPSMSYLSYLYICVNYAYLYVYFIFICVTCSLYIICFYVLNICYNYIVTLPTSYQCFMCLLCSLYGLCVFCVLDVVYILFGTHVCAFIGTCGDLTLIVNLFVARFQWPSPIKICHPSTNQEAPRSRHSHCEV